MISRKVFVWLMIIFLLPTLACSLTGGSDESGSSQVSLGAEATKAPQEQQDVIEEDNKQAVGETVEQVAEQEVAPDPAAPQSQPFTANFGLTDFSSFRATSLLEFEGGRGDDDSENTNAVQEYLLEVTRDPPARYQKTTIFNEGTVAADVESEYYLIDGIAYTKAFDNWIAQTGPIGLSQFSNPALFAHLPDSATCAAGTETVNGIAAVRCSFSTEDFGDSSLDAASINGAVWLAESGNTVVKYEMEAIDVKIKGAFEGSALQYFDVYRTTYNLSEVDGDIDISLPAEAEGTEVIDITTGGAPSGLIAPDQAEIALDNEAALIYMVYDMTTDDIANFHRETLSAEGWHELPDDSYVREYIALLAFEGQGGILRVFASQDIDGGYFVNVTMPFDMPDLGGGAAAGDDSEADADDDGTTSGANATGDADFPLMDDAADVLSIAGLTTYATQNSIESVIEYYRQQLPAEGWTENEGTAFSNDTSGLVMFSKDGQTLMVTANAVDGTTTVGLVVQEQ